jgi:ferredoxin
MIALGPLVNRGASDSELRLAAGALPNGAFMEVRVDDTLCQGHTLCHRIAPEVFELSGEDGHSSVPTANVAPQWHDLVRQAASNCPERAIVVTE